MRTSRHRDAVGDLLGAALDLRLAIDLGRPAAARAAVARVARSLPLCRVAAQQVTEAAPAAQIALGGDDR